MSWQGRQNVTARFLWSKIKREKPQAGILSCSVFFYSFPISSSYIHVLSILMTIFKLWGVGSIPFPTRAEEKPWEPGLLGEAQKL